LTDRNVIAKALYDFEGLHSEKLKTIKIDGFNAWQLVKTPIYFLFVGRHEGSTAGEGNENNNGAGNYLVRGLRLAGNVLYSGMSYVKLIFKKKFDLVFFYTHSIDKLTKQQDGAFFNYLTDAFITEGVVDNFLYGELSDNGDFRKPARIRPGLIIDRFNACVYLYFSLFCRTDDIRPVAGHIAALVNAHFTANNIEETVDAAFLAQRLKIFRSEYECWKVLLKAMNPRLIICSEKPGSGFLAACHSLHIRSVDLQHGVIDRFHPQYIYHPALRPVKHEMALPSLLGVFGLLHKELLLKNDFWERTEINVLGNSRIEMNRNQYGRQQDETLVTTVLLPTQWTCFQQTKEILESYIGSKKKSFRILLKLHPLEPEEYCRYYRELSAANAGSISIADKDDDIYRLITGVHVVIGFDSAVLLETASLGRPCITLTTTYAPKGILSLFGSDALTGAIVPVRYDDFEGLTALIEQSITNKTFYEDWLQKADKLSEYLYSADYIRNCRNLILQSRLN
jgi:hypothetical protein